ncbi:MAG: hypothetical protein LBH07_05425 [Treponema sp.]|jgi:ribosomal protein L37AE/L43A|nr:hypothetical protein [Treponema sp.]
MSKAHRGKGLRGQATTRGMCPLCKRDGVKILYELEANKTKIKVCKPCKAAVAHGKKNLSTLSVEDAARED